jgi:predicted CXXCH cytochrome family protein
VSLNNGFVRSARRLNRPVVIGVSAVVLSLWAMMSMNSCVSASRTIVAPPEIPNAEFVGSETCALCHEDIAARFAGATHDLLRGPRDEEPFSGCESCHGAGSIHVEEGGDAEAIINPKRDPRTCFQCHIEKRGEFSLPHHHPVTDGPLDLARGRITCGDCHQSHEGSAATSGAGTLRTTNELCTSCHTAQAGPFVFEHEAMRDGCTTCHQPHGSVNAKLLTERNATLCLKCHTQQRTAQNTIEIGGLDHSLFLSRGTCHSAGCHEAVHGSHVSSSLRF